MEGQVPESQNVSVSELIIKPSPYQELACGGTLKRNAESQKIDISSQPVAKKKTQNATLKVQPAQGLKIVQHRFSNGNSGNYQAGTNNAITTNTSSTQNNTQHEPSLASPNHLMYQDTRSGAWRTTDRLPRKNKATQDGGEPPKRRTRRSQTNNQDTQDNPARPEGETIPHLCTGLACEFPGCHSLSNDVSPVARGPVWESRATRRARRRQEAEELGRANRR